MNKIYPLILFFSGLLFLTCTSSCQHKEKTEEKIVIPTDTIQHTYQYGVCIDSLNLNEYTILPGDNPALIFSRLGFSASKSDSISRAAANVLDPTKIRAGMIYCTLTTQDSLETIRYITFAKSMTEYVVINLTTDYIYAYEYQKEITQKRRYMEGTINSSLWNVIKEKGVSPLLALKISDVFAWQIDFFDVKEGDSFQAIYNEAFIDDTTALGIASIDAAIFTHQGKTFTAIPFMQDSVMEFFDPEGNSLRKAFLKAPLDFFRITSRFSNARFHPILKRYRAHHGVDYAAPTGTPVKSIGAGTVIAKGYMNGGGHTIKIMHNSTYTTSYMHLSGYAKGLAVGSHVQQGEVIGYVGSTGLSTGPHLDFRVYKNGTPVNPLTIDAPPSLPIRAELKDSFIMIQKRYIAELESLHRNYTDSVIEIQAPSDSININLNSDKK